MLIIGAFNGFYISLPNILSWDDHNPLRESAQAEVLETCCFRSYRKTRVGGLALRPWSGDILSCKTQRHQNIQLNITNVYIKYMLSMLKYTYFQYMIRLINIFQTLLYQILNCSTCLFQPVPNAQDTQEENLDSLFEVLDTDKAWIQLTLALTFYLNGILMNPDVSAMSGRVG